MEIVAIAQRPAVGRSEQVAWTYSACCGRAGGVDVSDEEAGERRQANGPALLVGDRCIVEHEAEFSRQAVGWNRVLERIEQFAQQLAELVALGLAEAGE
jgi:hypothetical protein